MATHKTYRHKITGLVSSMLPITAAGMGDLLEEVEDGAKPRVPINELVARRGQERNSKKEQKDG